jgi:hypothetical protein
MDRGFENRVLRRIFGSDRNEVIGGWRKFHDEGCHKLYTLPNIVRMIKSRKWSLMGHVARFGAMRKAYNVLVGNLKETYHWEDVVSGKLILKLILEE